MALTVERRRYRKVSTRMWGDEKFRQLSRPQPNGQSLWQYLITGPHTTAVPGLFSAGEAQLAERLEWPLPAFRRIWKEIHAAEMGVADWKSCVVWLPNAIRHNAPESPNVVIGWKDALDELPACPLRDRALADMDTFLASVGETEAYRKAFRKVLPHGFAKALQKDLPRGSEKPSANQEQEQEVPPNPPKGLLVDDSVGDRARTFFERYPAIFAKCKNGAFYRPKEARDFGTVVDLVSAYPDLDRLCLMVEVFLKRTDIGPKNTPGTIGQFAHMAPDCDAKLRENRL